MKTYIIYCHTNKINGHKYIGYTKKTLEKRWQQHLAAANKTAKYHFHSAIKLYGADAFDHTTLVSDIETHEEAKRLECYYIAFYDTYNNGYNETKGGDGGATMTGRKHKPETIQKMRDWNIENSPTRGRKVPQEIIDKVAKANTGKKRSSDFKEASSLARRGQDNPAAKLDWDKVSKIRELLNDGDMTHKEIAKIFNIQQSIISRIKNNKIWKI